MVGERSLTVSIVNTREWEVLEACLTSLFEHPYTAGPFEVIVLNNGSRPGSAEPIRNRFPGVRIMEESRWRGFGANHNLIAGTASGDLLFILNPDAVVHARTLDRLAAAVTEQPDVAVAAGPILNPDGSVWTGAPFPFPSPLRALGQAIGTHRLRGNHAGARVAHIFSNGWVSGSAFMIDTATFSAVGGFDERFFIYAEEVDLMRRLIHDGWVLAWVPDAYVTHTGRSVEPETADRPQPLPHRLEDYEVRRIFQYVRSMTVYMEKHHGKLSALAFRLALGLDASLRLVMASIPPIGGLLEDRGPHPAVTRHHHLTKLRAAMRPNSGPSFAGLAADWNRDLAGSEGKEGH
jgi:N-acetylglucosaminyl-diphospho-decaprenol L-rhamnosyltransferase